MVNSGWGKERQRDGERETMPCQAPAPLLRAELQDRLLSVDNMFLFSGAFTVVFNPKVTVPATGFPPVVLLGIMPMPMYI